MREIVKNFEGFIRLNEALERDKNLESKWKELQDLGFYDASTPRMKKNGTILIKNDKLNYYPDGISIYPERGMLKSRSGILRNNASMEEIYDYLIQRFKKYKDQGSSGGSIELTMALKKMTKGGKSEKNPSTGRIDFSGNVDLTREGLDLLALAGEKIGVVKGDFGLRGKSPFSTLYEKDMDLLPTEVKGDFGIADYVFEGISSFEEKNLKIGHKLTLSDVLGLKSLSGIKMHSGPHTKIYIKGCRDLESLGKDLPEEVQSFSILTYPYSKGISVKCKLDSLEGSPSIVHGGFQVQNANIKNLKGMSDKIGGEIDLRENPIESLEGIPEDFSGNLFIDQIRCFFSLKERSKILMDGKYNPVDIITGEKTKEVEQLTPEQSLIIVSSFSLDQLQRLVDKNPEKMAIILVPIIKDPIPKEIVWPKNLKNEVDLLSSLGGVGL